MSSDQPRLNQLLHWAVENTPRPTDQTNQSSSSSSIKTTAITTRDDERTTTDNRDGSIKGSNDIDNKSKKKFDVGVLDAILGKQDSVRMREAIETFEDKSKTLDERCGAGELLEELVQDLDNANDMEVLGFWPRLIKLLECFEETEEVKDSIKFYACWICGTAVQNNPKSQLAFLKRDPIPAILEILSNSNSESTQSKALYCLSSTLRHSPRECEAMENFKVNQGFEVIQGCLTGPSMNLRRKSVFLINSLVLEDSIGLDCLRSTGVFKTLINSLSISNGIPTGPNGDLNCQDEDYTEKAIRAIVTIILKSINHSSEGSKEKTSLTSEERRSIREVFEENNYLTRDEEEEDDDDENKASEVDGDDEGSGKISSSKKKKKKNFESVLESSGIGRDEWKEVLEVL